MIRGLARRKVREAEGRFLAEGVRAVEDLLASPLRVELLVHASSLEDDPRAAALLADARRRGVPLRAVPDAELRRLADTETPQGVLAVAEIPRRGPEEVDVAEEPAAVLVLDAVQDPGNVGTLIRTAEALGASAAVLLPGTADAWSPKTVRAAMGSSFRLPVVSAGWDALAPRLRGLGVRVLAAAGGGEPLDRLPGDVPRRTALVLGNEGAGVSEATLARADAVVGIPLRGRAESLNVAAAGAILLHDLLRQRA